jgi:hypothetical protein
LILKQTFAGDELTNRLRVPKPGESPIYVAAEANHA